MPVQDEAAPAPRQDREGGSAFPEYRLERFIVPAMDNDMGVVRRKPCDFLSGAPAGRARPPGGPCERRACDGPPGGRPLPATLGMQKTRFSPDTPWSPPFTPVVRSSMTGTIRNSAASAWSSRPVGGASSPSEPFQPFERLARSARPTNKGQAPLAPSAHCAAGAAAGAGAGWKRAQGWRRKFFPIIGKLPRNFSNHWKTFGCPAGGRIVQNPGGAIAVLTGGDGA